MKKFLSMAMALVMALSLCAVVTAPEASASFEDIGDVSQYSKQAIEVIQAIQVMDGTTETEFSPAAGLTRRAAAKIICNMILGPTTAKALPTSANPFPDVPAGNQFAGYISYCQQQGIISGYGDGTFRPGDPLSGYAYLKMLLGALGYDALHEGFVGDNWKVNVAKIALGINLNKGIAEDFDGVTQITREDAAIYAFNTLQSDMMEYESKNTIEVNGVQVSMGGGNAVPQTWSTSSTNANNISAATDTGTTTGKPIVQFAERYFDKLERIPNGDHGVGVNPTNGKDEYTDGDLGRPSVIWYWKGSKIGTYQRDTSLDAYHGNVSPSTIYNDLKMSTERWAQVYFNGRDAGQVKIAKGNGDDINDQSASNVRYTSSGNIMDGKIGDGTMVEVYHNDANNAITICVINVWAGKISNIKDATSTKNERIVLDVGNWDEDDATRGDNRISKPKGIDLKNDRTEYELPAGDEGKYEEDDVVSYIYDEADNEIKAILDVLSSVEGSLTRRYADKSMVIDGETYKYAKNVSFDFRGAGVDENALSNKSEYVIYVDSDDLVLWVEESEFSDDQYVLIERMYLEDDAAAHVLSATLNSISYDGNGDQVNTTNVTLIDNAHSAPRAYLRFTSGSAREVTLNESEAYRQDDTHISADFFPGEIVRYSINSNSEYKLKATASVNYTGAVTAYAVNSNTLRGFKIGAQTVQADSTTKFIVNDGGTYKTYTGIRNVPDISNVTFGRAYCKDNLAKVVFFTNGNVEGSSNDIIFLASPSVSKRIDDDDFAPHFEYNAVVKNEITTLRVAYYVNAGSSGARLTINGVTTGNDGKDKCLLINSAKYDGDDVLKEGSFVPGAKGLEAFQAKGIKRVSGSVVDIKLDTARTELSKTLDDGVRVYFSNLDGEIEEIDVTDIRTDGNDEVYYVQDGGDITYMFIQEVDEDDDDDDDTTVDYRDGQLQDVNGDGLQYVLHYRSSGSVITDTTAPAIRTYVLANTAWNDLSVSSASNGVYTFLSSESASPIIVTLRADATLDSAGNPVSQ